jgi:hypothetical protein
MSGNHILVATMGSKSILRAVAGQIASQFNFVDYFPSYEIINSTPFRGSFFEPNQRNVNHSGVYHVMNSFFHCLNTKFPQILSEEKLNSPEQKLQNKKSQISPEIRQARQTKRIENLKMGQQKSKDQQGVVCEEELLNAFAK